MKAKIIFKVDLKTLINETLVDPKLLQLRICLRNKQNERAPKEISPVLTKLTERFGSLSAGDKIVIPEELKKQVGFTTFWTPQLNKILAESSIFWWVGMLKEIEERCSTCASAYARVRHRTNLGYR